MTMITGQKNINRYRMKVLLSGLNLEINTGMKLSRGRTCYSIIKSEYGLKGNKKKVYEQFEKIVNNSWLVLVNVLILW